MLSSVFGNPWWQHRMLGVLRIVAGFLFVFHGTQKLFGFPPSANPQPPAELFSLMGLAGVLETFGGALLIVGLGTRVVAFILAGEMAVAYFKAHAPQAFYPIQNRGELAALYSFLFLYLSFAGPGAYSIDSWLASRRKARMRAG